MEFKAKTFVTDVEAALSSGQQSLDLLIDAYSWAFDHIKEVRKYSRDYSQAWLEMRIKRIYNVDPERYAMLCVRLGGGKNHEQKKAGRSIVQQIGYWECYRADRLLTKENLAKLGKMVTSKMTTDEFVQAVDQMAEILKNKSASEPLNKIDYRREYYRLVQEVAALRSENKMLRELFRRAKIEVSQE